MTMETTQYGCINPEHIEAMKHTDRKLGCPYRNMQECWVADCQCWDRVWKDCGLKSTYGK